MTATTARPDSTAEATAPGSAARAAGGPAAPDLDRADLDVTAHGTADVRTVDNRTAPPTRRDLAQQVSQEPVAGSPRTPAKAAAGRKAARLVEQVTGAKSVVRSLEELGVEVVFGIPGGAVLPLYDPLMDSVKVRHILVRHEQGAGHAAEGYAQATGRVGVCIATSPAPARPTWSPRSPTPTWTRCRSWPSPARSPARHARHRRFPGSRHLRHHDADHEAQLPRHRPGGGCRRGPWPPRSTSPSTGRPGPVLVDVRQGHRCRPPVTFIWPESSSTCRDTGRTIKPHSKQIREAGRGPDRRPPGGRCSMSAAASSRPRRWAEQLRCTGRADRCPRRDHPDGPRRVPRQPHPAEPRHAGNARHVSPRSRALQKADLLIALGTRFDDRVTGQLESVRPRTRSVIHADIDPAEISEEPDHADVPIVGDVPGDARPS